MISSRTFADNNTANRLHVKDLHLLVEAIRESVGDWLNSHELEDIEDVFDVESSFSFAVVAEVCDPSYLNPRWGGEEVPRFEYYREVMWHLVFGAACREDFPAYASDGTSMRGALRVFFAEAMRDVFYAFDPEQVFEEIEFVKYDKEVFKLFGGVVPDAESLSAYWNNTSKDSIFARLESLPHSELRASHELAVKLYAERPLGTNAYDAFVEWVKQDTHVFASDYERACFMLGSLFLYAYWEEADRLPVRIEDTGSRNEAVIAAFDRVYRAYMSSEETVIRFYHIWLRSTGRDRDVLYHVEDLYGDLDYMVECDFKAEYWYQVMSMLGEFEHHNGFLLEWSHVEPIVMFYLPSYADVHGGTADVVAQVRRVQDALMPLGDTNYFIEGLRTLGPAAYVVGFKEWLASGKLLGEFLEELPPHLRALWRQMNIKTRRIAKSGADAEGKGGGIVRGY